MMQRTRQNPRRRGATAIVMVVVLLLVAIVVIGATLTGARDQDLTVRRVETVQSFYAAESGMNMAIREIVNNTDEDGDGGVGTISDDGNDANNPTINSASFVVTSDSPDDSTLLTSVGIRGVARRVVEAEFVGGDGGSGINLESLSMTSYVASQDQTGTVTFGNGGTSINVTGNRWLALEFPYAMTADTMISFEFMSTQQGEVHGIGLEENIGSISSNRVFRLYGTQNWGIGTYDTYSGTGWQSFTIPAGQHYAQNATHLVIVMDHDVGSPTGNSQFRNIQVYEN